MLISKSKKSVVQTMGMQYNDDQLCAASLPQNKGGGNPYQDELDFLNGGSHGANVSSSINNEQLFIYPNPNIAGGQLSIAYNMQGNEDGQLIIHNMVGQVIQKIELSVDANRVLFNLDYTLSAGTYKVTLWQGNKLLTTKKLSIGN